MMALNVEDIGNINATLTNIVLWTSILIEVHDITTNEKKWIHWLTVKSVKDMKYLNG